MEREDGVSLCARYTSPFDRLTVLSAAEGRTISDEEEHSVSAVEVPAFVNHADQGAGFAETGTLGRAAVAPAGR
jgi:hypothetical protein